MLKKMSLFFLIVTFVLACQPEIDTPPDPPKKNCLISKMIQGTHNGADRDTTFTFYYNDTGRLDRINMTNLIDFEEDYDLHYDSHDRLIKVTGYPETDFIYNAKGQLSAVQYLRFSDSSKIEFIYGTSDLPTGAVSYEKMNGQWGDPYEYKYTFQNGNMVKLERYYNGALQGTQTFEYYDNIPNDFKLHSLLSINSVPLGYFEEFLYFNKNLLKKSGFNNARYLDYKLDSGRIARSIVSWLTAPNDTGMRESKNYFYNCK